MEKILIVEDDIAFGTMIQTWLRKKGFEVEKTTSVKAAIQVCEEAERGFDLVLSDLRLPDHDGIFLLQWMRKHGVQVPFIVMTSYAEIQNVVLAMKSGATDYVAKPFHPEILLDKIKEAIKAPKKQDSNAASADSLRSTDTNSTPTDAAPGKQAGNQASSANGDVPKYLEGESEASRKLYSFVSLVAPTPMSVLILGASGTGKEYVARRIHELSTRANKPFFALDCGAIPKEVAASEFFGHVKGSFTGADQDKKGIFPAACDFTTDLHSMGQWIQQGERSIFETVISVETPNEKLLFPHDDENLDGLNFLEGKRVDEVNKMAELGTRLAHVDGGVPNILVNVPELNAYYLGQLIYFFEKACGISGLLEEVNPFNQPGVEAYKKNMFALLNKPGYEAESKAIQERLANEK